MYKRKKPPSQIRYERSHPVISARVDMETYRKLQKMARSEEKTLSGFLKDFVRDKKESWSKSYNKGYRAGKKDYEVWFRCNVCNEKMLVDPRGPEHDEIVKYMKDQGWGHVECHKRKK